MKFFIITIILLCSIDLDAQENPCSRFGTEDYHLSGYSWDNPNIKYYFKNFTSDLTQDQIRQAFSDAFNKWANVTGLTFIETLDQNEADITMRWHTEGSFYNSNSTFALTYYPPPYHDKSGDMEFNENINWKVQKVGDGSSDLRYVALHEIGHVLGLCHSGNSSAVMYYPFVHKLDLIQADINGITSIYIKIKNKNEFKNPDGSISNGGLVNVENQDYDTNSEPNNEKTLTFNNGSQRRFEAKEQSFNQIERKFNPFEQYSGGWNFNNGVIDIRIGTTAVINQNVASGTYKAVYRYKTNIGLTANTEFNGNINTGLSIGQIYQYENGTITAPSPYQPSGSTINYNFAGWTDNFSAYNPRTITPTDNQTYTALYKVPHKSNQTNAYSNTSQRRFVETFNPNLNLKTLHIVYESMGHVWYETSTNNGVTWNIMNNGRPLDTGGGRTPSMDYHYQNGSNNQMNEIIIVWQENFNGWACIKIATFYHDGSSAYAPFVKLYDGFVLGPDQIEFAKPFSENSNPVVGWTDQDVESQALILWQGKYDDIFGKIEGLVYKIGRITGAGATWDINIPAHLSTQTFSTNINSVNPTITNYKESYYGYNWHIAWEQIINSSTSQIKYSRLDWNILNNQLTIGSIEEASLNSGYSKNYNPVIIVRKAGTSQEYIFLTWLGNRTSPTTETRVLLKYKLGSNWSVTGVYGTTPVQNFSINKGTEMTNNLEPLALCWSEQSNYPFTTKLMKSPGSGILTIPNLTGKDMQINNGTNFSSMFANSFSSASLPYSFSLSQNFGSINKENSMQIFNGREGIVGKNDAQFFFALGDISVDGQNIKFVSIPDSVSVSSLSLLNTYFESEPFTVSSTSNLTYGVQYGITDSLLCSTVLNTNENISFKLELIDAVTNQVLGVYDEVTYTNQNVFQYNNIGYRVNLSGIGERAVKFRLATSTNTEFGYGLANRIADENILAKGSYQSINYQGNLAVTDYALEQNYPNPFNPSTTIKFQIPADGFVTLKVYDILGNEVTTLINEEKPAGRYEVNFNASSLASGVYIYKIQAGSFISSKKMLLLK